MDSWSNLVKQSYNFKIQTILSTNDLKKYHKLITNLKYG